MKVMLDRGAYMPERAHTADAGARMDGEQQCK